MTPSDRLLADLQHVVDGALAVDASLLAAGEIELSKRILGLSGDPGRLYARLLSRRGDVFRLDTLQIPGLDDHSPALDALEELDLVHAGLSAQSVLPLLTVAELAALTGRKGRKTELQKLLSGLPPIPARRVVGRSLVRRLETLYFRDPGLDRHSMLLGRVGAIKWPEYTPGPSGPCFANRSDLAAFFAARGAPPQSAAEALQGAAPLADADPALRRLDLRRWLLSRAAELATSRAELESLLHLAPERTEAVVRLALACEREGDPDAGARVCLDWRSRVRPEEGPGLERTGRRLARKAGRPWVPAPPLRAAPERELLIPAWQGAVEEAVASALSPRRAFFAENVLWTTLFGLLFYDLYWIPVPGMLPTRWRSGPVDLGRPGFAERRSEPFARVLAALSAGEGEAVLEERWNHHQGEAVAGVSWELASVDELRAVVRGLGGPALAAVLGDLGRRGWSAARGLPDLVVLPGPELELRGAFPSRLDPGLRLVEVKGPNDELRDAQRAWHHRLQLAGVSVEVVRVRPLGPTGEPVPLPERSPNAAKVPTRPRPAVLPIEGEDALSSCDDDVTGLA